MTYYCYNDSLWTCGGWAFNPKKYECDSKNIMRREFTDARDGKTYRTVVIFGVEWMAQNLNYAYLAKTDKYDSSSFCYGDNPLNCDKYGRLYLWSAAMDSIGAVERNGGDVSGENVCGYNKKCNTKGKVQGICPEGFHLPDTTEWLSLLRPLAESFRNDEYIGAANKLRELSWKTSQGGNDGAQANYYGFSALPGGYLRSYSYTQSIVDGVGADNVAAFWSSTQKDEDEVYGVLVRDVDQVFLGASGKAFIAYSVRCVGD